MYTQFYGIRLLVAAALILGGLYALGLWCFAFIRTSFAFFLLLAISSAGSLFLGLINAVYAYNLSAMRELDPLNVIYGSFLVLQPVVLLLSLIGQTILVRWLLRNTPRSHTQGEAETNRRYDKECN
jgi:hypothetical protein